MDRSSINLSNFSTNNAYSIITVCVKLILRAFNFISFVLDHIAQWKEYTFRLRGTFNPVDLTIDLATRGEDSDLEKKSARAREKHPHHQGQVYSFNSSTTCLTDWRLLIDAAVKVRQKMHAKSIFFAWSNGASENCVIFSHRNKVHQWWVCMTKCFARGTDDAIVQTLDRLRVMIEKRDGVSYIKYTIKWWWWYSCSRV